MSSSNVVSRLLDILEWVTKSKTKFIIADMLDECGVSVTQKNIDFCAEFLEYNYVAFNMMPASLYWIGKDALFNETTFTLQPTKFEIEKGVLIPGSRFDPYICGLLEEVDLELSYAKKMLYTKLVEVPYSEIKKYYYFWTNEEILDKLSSVSIYNKLTPEEEEEEIDENRLFFVPSFNLKVIYKIMDFQEGQCLIFRISDLTYKKIDLISKTHASSHSAYKLMGITNFEKYLKLAIKDKATESSAIEDVLSYMMFLGKEEFLYNDYCPPLQDYILGQDILEEVILGVKTAKWIKGAKFLSHKTWFNYIMDVHSVLQKKNSDEYFFVSIYSPITEAMIQIFIYSFLEQNYIKASESPSEYRDKCVNSFLSEFFNSEKYAVFHKKISNILYRKYDKYAPRYNPFKKREEMSVAFSMFDIFRRVYALIAKLENINVGPRDIEYHIATVIFQMTKEMETALFGIKKLLDRKELPESARFILLMNRLIEKFSFIYDNFEVFVFSHFRV